MAENLIRGQKVSVNLAPGGEPQDIPKYVGLVVDLTNSSRYYDSGLWQQLNLEYSKVGMIYIETVRTLSIVQHAIELGHNIYQRCSRHLLLLAKFQ